MRFSALSVYGWWPRWPGILLATTVAALCLSLPGGNLNADSAVFGLMGEDAGRNGYWPTLMYGQNYLFSPVPYVYAAFRALLPSGIPSPWILALSGAVLSVAGLWLIVDALFRVQRRLTGRPLAAGWIFALLMGAGATYLSDLLEVSGIETSLLVLGLIVAAAARIEERMAGPHAAAAGELPVPSRPAGDGWAWGLLGAAVGFALCSRPQIIFYGLPPAGLLALAAWRSRGFRSLWAPGWRFAAGAAAGYLPMLAHRFFRAADWPYAHELSFKFGSLSAIRESAGVQIGTILPTVFTIDPAWPVRNVLCLAWLLAAILLYAWSLWKNPRRLSVLDHAWVAGTAITVAVMVLVPALSFSSMQRRYCLHALPAAAWIFARLAPGGPRWRTAAALSLVIGLAVASLSPWRERLSGLAERDRQVREVRERLVPELAAHDTVIVAGYWDAYLLSFLAEGRLRVEANPWDMVRTYGRIAEADFERRHAWLIPAGRGRLTGDRLKQEAGERALDGMRDLGVQNRFMGRPCDLWQLADPTLVVRLMRHYHPLYFRAAHPPGSAPLKPASDAGVRGQTP